MKSFKVPKYSDVFYKKSVLRFSIILTVISIIIFFIFGYLLFYNNLSKNKSNMQSECKNAYLSFSSTLENCTSICSYLSTIKKISPVFQSQTQINLYREVLTEEIKSVILSFDYISYIEIETDDFTVRYGQSESGDFKYLATYNQYTVNYKPDSSWPKTVELVYKESTAGKFIVKLHINILSIGRTEFSADTYLISSDGYIVISNDTGKNGGNINELYGFKWSDIENSGLKYQKSVIAFSEDELYFLTVKPLSSLIGDSIYQILLLLAAFMVTLIISSLLIFKMIKSVYKPIEKSMDVLKYYIPNDDTSVEEDIDFILEHVVDDSLNSNAKRTVSQIRKSQLHTLHSQITPHFLGNSLEVIKIEINNIIGNHNPIEEALSTLSSFLHDLHEYQQMIIPLSQEIEKSKKYINMISFCFSRDLTVEWDVDENLLDCAIISLTFQPIIENSVIHGFTNCINNPKIKIKIFAEKACDSPSDANIVLIVSDNGNGMDPAVLKDIRRGISDSAYSSNRHMGLKNTNQKFRLLYGDDYGIKSIRSDNNGTSVTIIFPYYRI